MRAPLALRKRVCPAYGGIHAHDGNGFEIHPKKRAVSATGKRRPGEAGY
ncbi:hypothetical protein [Methylacidimicrobium cyclopophantes]|nr:hypothetical protein [Methylacidimicrobium cyclopophantes]